SAEQLYWNSWGQYAPLLANLGCNGGACPNPPTAAAAGVVDEVVASNNGGRGKSGYNYGGAGIAAAGGPAVVLYQVTADPLTINSTGVRGFCATEDGVVRFQNPDAGPYTRATCIALPNTPGVSGALQ